MSSSRSKTWYEAPARTAQEVGSSKKQYSNDKQHSLTGSLDDIYNNIGSRAKSGDCFCYVCNAIGTHDQKKNLYPQLCACMITLTQQQYRARVAQIFQFVKQKNAGKGRSKIEKQGELGALASFPATKRPCPPIFLVPHF